MTAWMSAGRGIRYREHESRRHRQRPDRYWCLRYNLDGIEVKVAVDWCGKVVVKAPR